MGIIVKTTSSDKRGTIVLSTGLSRLVRSQEWVIGDSLPQSLPSAPSRRLTPLTPLLINMIRSVTFVLFLLSVMLSCTAGFVSPVDRRSATSLQMMAIMDAPMPATIISPINYELQRSTFSDTTTINNGIGRYLSAQQEEESSSIMSSATILSLKERPPPPSAEELAAKKATFNLWFWGGGFVAPFLATFYYFGFKFWER